MRESVSSRTSSSSSTSTSSSSSSSASTSVTTMEAAVDAHAILRAHAASVGPASFPPNASVMYEPSRAFLPYVSLGPVVGLVTDTTARVLIEVSLTTEVRCFLTDKNGVQHGSRRVVQKHRPFVFAFEGLKPKTYYRLTFDIPVPGLVNSGFSTLPRDWDLRKGNARIAAVAQNAFYSNQEDIPHKSDLWRTVHRKVKGGKCNYLFHLGDNVYVDSDRYKTDGAQKSYSGKAGSNPYLEAHSMLQGTPQSHWRECEKHVLEMFREAYRLTWNFPTTKQCLASCPNLMILNEHEIEAGLGRYNNSRDPDGLENFLSHCAYEVYNEYCRALFEDYPKVERASESVKVGQAYHFHSLGDIGLMFIDDRAANALHKHHMRDDTHPLLGGRQWDDIDFALSANGYLEKCKMLIVCTSSPVALSGEPNCLAQMCMTKATEQSLLNSWNAPHNMPEASLLLHKIFDWRAVQPGRRNVCVLSGGGGVGGITDIVDLRFHKSDPRLDRLKQVSTGPIGNKMNLCNAQEASLYLAGGGVNALGANHQFKHYNVTPGRSFAMIEIHADSHAEAPNFEITRYVAMGKKRISMKPVGSSHAERGCGWGGNPAGGPDHMAEYGEGERCSSSSSSSTSTSTSSSSSVSSSDRGGRQQSKRSSSYSRSKSRSKSGVSSSRHTRH